MPDDMEGAARNCARYNQGVGISAASGSVLALIVSIITLLIDKLTEVSSSNPVLIISLAAITGLTILALVIGVIMIMVGRGSSAHLSNHINDFKSFLNDNCEVDDNGSVYLKQQDGSRTPISHQYVSSNVVAMKKSPEQEEPTSQTNP